MATFVQYANYESSGGSLLSVSPLLTPIGYLNMDPPTALKEILPVYHVIDFLGIRIPSRSEFDNLNHGLRLSKVDNGLGLVGTVKMLEEGELFQRARREDFSEVTQKTIAERMKSKMGQLGYRSEPLHPHEVQDWRYVFELHGDPISSEEIIQLSTPERYGEPLDLPPGVLEDRPLRG